MRVMVVGGGGREHALAWKLSKSDKVDKLYAWPGNAGIGQVAERVGKDVMEIGEITEFAQRERIDLTIVGPESPLIVGLVDELKKRGLKAFGPNREAAQMEGSKVFAKHLMLEHGIPTAYCECFDDADRADAYIESVALRTQDPIVVKADGEAAGKGVFVALTKQDALAAVDTIMRQRAFGKSGDRVVVEEFLDGPEASFMCFVDGETFVPMMPAQDHKRAYDNDEGPNTGGMGCYSPVPVFTDDVRTTVIDTIVKPTLAALKKRGIHYQGVLYVGLALTSHGPKVVEFNARFGDPETQVVLPLMETDLVDVCLAVADGKLDSKTVNWYDKKALCVVMASGGYPGSYEKGKPISGIDEAERTGALVFHAGTEMKDGQLVTSGGRVLGVTGLADTFQTAYDNAYAGVRKISFDGVHYRTDIGRRLFS
jgi:phosphoribosylamine--glycine ligase